MTIDSAAAVVAGYGITFSPRSIYLGGDYGPALVTVIGYQGNNVTFGPDNPMVNMDLESLYGGISALDSTQYVEYAEALDALAAAVCPQPVATETATGYIATLKANYSYVSGLFL